ncbi:MULTISPECIES: hypothetical protein [Actinomadura]|uniref:DUF320 domain-containing protein n=1 Tax=Actinomadura yumaensis TaxID=111807 RepID=A0ABW2CD58_9ACTN|nr:hypothetical protein [Actinomadura sp. J1-007]MWK35730.1 hypothetical protein [Actinomadura sp. J1-007]
MIKTALKTGAVAATLAGAAFVATPAMANTNGNNNGQANGNNVNVQIVGGYGVTCGSVSLAGQSGTDCNGNGVHNHGNDSESGAIAGNDD